MMKSIAAALFTTALLIPGGSAAVLVGFHAFDNDSLLAEAADVTVAGFTATITKNTESYGGGSNDNYFGDSSFQVRPNPTDDGVYRSYSGTNTITTSYSAAATGAYQLSSLYLDIGTTTTPIGNFSVSYSLNGESSVLLTPTPIPLTVVGTGFVDFPDVNVSFGGLTLNPGDQLVLSLTIGGGGSARMDNIAIAGELIPEPSSLLLSAIVPAFLLKRRRRH